MHTCAAGAHDGREGGALAGPRQTLQYASVSSLGVLRWDAEPEISELELILPACLRRCSALLTGLRHHLPTGPIVHVRC